MRLLNLIFPKLEEAAASWCDELLIDVLGITPNAGKGCAFVLFFSKLWVHSTDLVIKLEATLVVSNICCVLT